MLLHKEQYYWAIGVALFGLLGTVSFPQYVTDTSIIALVLIWFGGIILIGLYKNRNMDKAMPNDESIVEAWESGGENRLKPYPRHVLNAYKRQKLRDKKK